MIEKLEISNYRSHGGNTVLSMIPAEGLHAHDNHITHEKPIHLLRLSAIIGSNSTGKSNFTHSIIFLKKFVLGECTIDMFKKHVSKEKDDSEINLIFVTNRNNRFKYTLSYKIGSFFEKIEWMNANLTETILEFDSNSLCHDKNFSKKSSIFCWWDCYRNAYPYPFKYNWNVCFQHLMFDLRQWFADTLQIIDYRDMNYLDGSYESMAYISSIVSGFDIDISELYWKDVTDLKKIDELIEKLRYSDVSRMGGIYNKIISANLPKSCMVSFVHSDSRNFFHISYVDGAFYVKELVVRHTSCPDAESTLTTESMGTRRLIQLASLLIKKNSDKVYIIDEMNYKLHPNVTKHFIEMFGSMNISSQLIFNTHESSILTTELLRYDEINVVDKSENGISHMHRVSDLPVEINDCLDVLYYKNGVFGGIPRY